MVKKRLNCFAGIFLVVLIVFLVAEVSALSGFSIQANSNTGNSLALFDYTFNSVDGFDSYDLDALGSFNGASLVSQIEGHTLSVDSRGLKGVYSYNLIYSGVGEVVLFWGGLGAGSFWLTDCGVDETCSSQYGEIDMKSLDNYSFNSIGVRYLRMDVEEAALVEKNNSVERSFSFDEVEKGKNVTIILAVDVGGAGFYAIDESVPTGFEVVDAGLGDVSEVGHIKWVETSGAVDVNYSYVVRVADGVGEYDFYGEYMFEEDSSERVIGGESLKVIGLYGDKNEDREVSIIELIVYIGKWKSGDYGISLPDLMKSILYWARGYV